MSIVTDIQADITTALVNQGSYLNIYNSLAFGDVNATLANLRLNHASQVANILTKLNNYITQAYNTTPAVIYTNTSSQLLGKLVQVHTAQLELYRSHIYSTLVIKQALINSSGYATAANPTVSIFNTTEKLVQTLDICLLNVIVLALNTLLLLVQYINDFILLG